MFPECSRYSSHTAFSGYVIGLEQNADSRDPLSLLDVFIGAPVILIGIDNDLLLSYHIANNSTGTVGGVWPPQANSLVNATFVNLVNDTRGLVYYPSSKEITHVLVKIDMHDGATFQMPGLPANTYAVGRTTPKNTLCQDGVRRSASQFPLRLFYACTCNKIQGRSIRGPLVLGDISASNNYLYVVRTRVLYLSQLYLSREITEQDAQTCQTNPLLVAEMVRLRTIEEATIARIVQFHNIL